MEFKEFMRLSSAHTGKMARLREAVLPMRKGEVIEYEFMDTNIETFKTYLKIINRQSKPKHWKRVIKKCKTGAFIARDV